MEIYRIFSRKFVDAFDEHKTQKCSIWGDINNKRKTSYYATSSLVFFVDLQICVCNSACTRTPMRSLLVQSRPLYAIRVIWKPDYMKLRLMKFHKLRVRNRVRMNKKKLRQMTLNYNMRKPLSHFGKPCFKKLKNNTNKLTCHGII